MTIKPELDFLADLDRACEAAARGDFRDAERWTGLAERKLSMARRFLRTAIDAGFEKELGKAVRRTRSTAAGPATEPPESGG
jgi:hypothetical protein